MKQQPINLKTCRADYEVASRKPHLMECWGYEYGHRLLTELEAAREQIATLTRVAPASVESSHCANCGEELVERPGGTYWGCTECGAAPGEILVEILVGTAAADGKAGT